MANTYTDQQVAEALAALELNGGNVKRTAAETGIPRATLIRWRDGVSAALDTMADTPDTPAALPEVVALVRQPPQPRDFATLWAEAQYDVLAAAVAVARQLTEPTAENLTALTKFAGMAADKHLDYSQGRKGAGSVNIAGEKVLVVMDV